MSESNTKSPAKEYFDYQGFGGKLILVVGVALVAIVLALIG